MLELSQCVLNVCHSPKKHIYLPWWVCAEQPPLSFSQSEPSVLWWCIWGNPPLKVSTDTKCNSRSSILSLVPRGKAITGGKMISPVSFWWFSRLDSKLLLLCDTWVEWKTGSKNTTEKDHCLLSSHLQCRKSYPNQRSWVILVSS